MAFDALVSDVEDESGGTLVVTSMVHVVATTGNLVGSYLVVLDAQLLGLPQVVGFLRVVFQACFSYNLLLLETAIARTVASVVENAASLDT